MHKIICIHFKMNKKKNYATKKTKIVKINKHNLKVEKKEHLCHHLHLKILERKILVNIF